jgi:hypothetical protein
MADSPETESPRKDWRELCAAAVIEPDSERLVSLVHQILQALDEGDHAAILSDARRQSSGRPHNRM